MVSGECDECHIANKQGQGLRTAGRGGPLELREGGSGSRGEQQVQRPWGGMEGHGWAEGAQRTVSQRVLQGAVGPAGPDAQRCRHLRGRRTRGRAGFWFGHANYELLGNLTIKVVRGTGLPWWSSG